MKIQKTTVSELENGQARVYMLISNKTDSEPSDQHVVFSVLIDRPETAHEFESIQLRALTKANDLIDQVAGAIEKNRPDR